MAKRKKHRIDKRWLRALYQYAAEHEGRHRSVRIAGRTVHTVDCGTVGQYVAGEWTLVGYWVRLTRADARWMQVEFTRAGAVVDERFGNSLEA